MLESSSLLYRLPLQIASFTITRGLLCGDECLITVRGVENVIDVLVVRDGVRFSFSFAGVVVVAEEVVIGERSGDVEFELAPCWGGGTAWHFCGGGEKVEGGIAGGVLSGKLFFSFLQCGGRTLALRLKRRQGNSAGRVTVCAWLPRSGGPSTPACLRIQCPVSSIRVSDQSHRLAVTANGQWCELQQISVFTNTRQERNPGFQSKVLQH